MIVNGFDQTIPNSGGAFTNNSVYNAFPERFEQFSQEVRILSPVGETFEFIAGLYYDHSKYQLEQFQGFNILDLRSEEHTSELQSLMRISYAVFCLKKKNKSKMKQIDDISCDHKTHQRWELYIDWIPK